MFRKRKSLKTETDSLVDVTNFRLVPDNGNFISADGEKLEVRGFDILSLDGEVISPSNDAMVLEGLFYFRLAGITHYQDASNLVGGTGQEVLFGREPDNPVDENAIKILYDGKTVGHVPATLTGEMAPYLTSADNKGAEVATGTKGKVVKTFHKKGKVAGARVIVVVE